MKLTLQPVRPLPTKHISDERLVDLLKKDDERALDEIFNRYWEMLFQMAYKVLYDENASKDVVQEILVNVWERRQVANINNLKAYLIQAVKHRIAVYLRNGKFTDRHWDKLESSVFVNYTEETINFNELERTILDSLDNLPDRCGEIFYLSRFQGLNNREIAEKLNLSIRTVETQISKALKFLRSEIKPSLLFLLVLLFSQ